MNFRIITLVCSVLFFCLYGCNKKLINKDYFEKIGNYKLNYSIKGNGSEVMIVGHQNSGKIGYELTLKPLEDKFKMVYYEPRGTGKSEVPKNIIEYNQDYLVQEIEDLRRKLNVDKIWLFAHSDQSSIALIYALKYPKHTKGLILTGTSLVGTQQESIQRRKESEIKRSEMSGWFANVIKDWDYMIENKTTVNRKGEDISDTPLKWWCFNEESAQKVIPIAHKIAEQGRRKPINNTYFIETKEEREKYLNYQKEFYKIKVPTLIINGKYDTNNPPLFVEKLHEILPNSTLIFIEKSGHFPWIENKSSTFNQINQWLKKFNNL